MWEVKVYIEGKGVTKDLPKAKSLFQKGCDLDAGLACRMLGTMYQKGNSVTQDLSKAEALYQKCNQIKDESKMAADAAMNRSACNNYASSNPKDSR